MFVFDRLVSISGRRTLSFTVYLIRRMRNHCYQQSDGGGGEGDFMIDLNLDNNKCKKLYFVYLFMFF